MSEYYLLSSLRMFLNYLFWHTQNITVKPRFNIMNIINDMEVKIWHYLAISDTP